MLAESVGSLPGWLLTGVALGGLLALAAAAVFLVGVRLFPDRATRTEGRAWGERRRRAEIREYLTVIDEPYLEDHVVAGRPAAFFLPERGVAITFDARDYFRFERAGVVAVLLEYELPGAGIGSRLPFETPEPGGGTGRENARSSHRRRRVRADGPAGVSRSSALAVLGLDSDATEEDVRRAYRTRVKDVHPDHGGDVDAFRRLREAYTVAREGAE